MGLWKLGGTHKKAWCRDVIIPIILGGYLIYRFFPVWWVGFLSIGAFQIIKIGYGCPDETDEGSFLGRLVYNNIGSYPFIVRGLAGLIYGLSGLSVYLFYTQHLHIYCSYAVINMVVNAVGEKMKWKDYIVEPLAGLGIASLVILI